MGNWEVWGRIVAAAFRHPLLSIAPLLQSPNSKGIQPRIGTEDRKMMLDRRSGNIRSNGSACVPWTAKFLIDGDCPASSLFFRSDPLEIPGVHFAGYVTVRSLGRQALPLSDKGAEPFRELLFRHHTGCHRQHRSHDCIIRRVPMAGPEVWPGVNWRNFGNVPHRSLGNQSSRWRYTRSIL